MSRCLTNNKLIYCSLIIVNYCLLYWPYSLWIIINTSFSFSSLIVLFKYLVLRTKIVQYLWLLFHFKITLIKVQLQKKCKKFYCIFLIIFMNTLFIEKIILNENYAANISFDCHCRPESCHKKFGIYRFAKEIERWHWPQKKFTVPEMTRRKKKVKGNNSLLVRGDKMWNESFDLAQRISLDNDHICTIVSINYLNF